MKSFLASTFHEPFPMDVLAIISVLVYFAKFSDCEDPYLIFKKTKSAGDWHRFPREWYFFPVHRGYDLRNGEKICVRVVTSGNVVELGRNSKLDTELRELLDREKTWSNILYRCHDYFFVMNQLIPELHLFYEHFSITLSDLIFEKGSEGRRYYFSEHQIAFVLMQVLDCLLYLESNYLLKLELRPGSIIFLSKGILLPESFVWYHS
jgi:hypothetical protein